MLPGQTDRTQAKYEAQARISWGDAPKDVITYLMSHGFSREDASSMVEEMFRERSATIRGKGIRYILGGIALICVPVLAFFYFLFVGYILVKTFLLFVVIGLGGVYLVIKGAGMVIAPKSEQGDVAEP
jgi:hypothetical protein